MTPRHAPDTYAYAQYTALRRLERHIRRLARSRGLPADPLADAPPVAMTLDAQLSALELHGDIPEDLRRLSAAWPMAQAAAYGDRRRAGL